MKLNYKLCLCPILIIVIAFILSFVSKLGRHVFSLEDENWDSVKSPSAYLLSYGYKFEEHKVLTKDGYILTVWRVGNKEGAENRNREHREHIEHREHPCILAHGLMDNGFSYLFKSIESNLPIMLVNEGYDVWITNNRGQINSLEHISLVYSNPTSNYWNFSFHEMGVYDLPAFIDYVLNTTGCRKVNYIAHSQGTTQFFVKGSMDINYINEHINSFTAFAPAMYIREVMGFLKSVSTSDITEYYYSLNLKNFWVTPYMLPMNAWLWRIMPHTLYNTLIPYICGVTSRNHFDFDRIGVLGEHQPGGTSAQNLKHWVQNIKSGRFQMFDYGGDGQNKWVYRDYIYTNNTNHIYPPEYPVHNLKLLNMDILAFYSPADAIVSLSSALTSIDMLRGGNSNVTAIQIEDYGHLDFLWAKDAHIHIYSHVLNFLNTNNQLYIRLYCLFYIISQHL